VSVVIPLYNRKNLIGEAIESVLNQDYPSVEIIVVDDGSTDGGAEKVKSYPAAKYIWQVNAGPGAARNLGVAQSSGEILAFLDSDDLWLPTKLSQQIESWAETTSPTVFVCETRLHFAADQPLPTGYSRRMLEGSFPAYLPSAMMVSRAVFDQVGGFDPSFRSGQDTDWFFRAVEMGIERVVVPAVLFEKRMNGDNITGAVEKTRATIMKLLRASLQRKRKLDCSNPA